MAHVLLMAARELRNPVAELVLVETGDCALHSASVRRALMSSFDVRDALWRAFVRLFRRG